MSLHNLPREALSTTEVSTTQDVFDVAAFINSRPVGAVQYGIIVLCGLILFLDGFDTQAISYMAPLIAKEWGLSRELLGPIFSSALTGLMVGYLVLSPLSDRFGHRRLIINWHGHVCASDIDHCFGDEHHRTDRSYDL